MDFDPMKAADELKKLVEVWTGVRNRFIQAGWSEEAAEQMTLEVMRSSH